MSRKRSKGTGDTASTVVLSVIYTLAAVALLANVISPFVGTQRAREDRWQDIALARALERAQSADECSTWGGGIYVSSSYLHGSGQCEEFTFQLWEARLSGWHQVSRHKTRAKCERAAIRAKRADSADTVCVANRKDAFTLIGGQQKERPVDKYPEEE